LRAFRSVWIVSMLAGLVLSAGCFDGDDPDRYGKPPTGGERTPASASPSVSASPSDGLSDEEAIKAQYRRFWTEILPAASAANEDDRRAILVEAVMDPELSVLLKNMANQDSRGVKGYGADVPLAESIEHRSGVALVRGCLDSSNSGVRDGKTGRRITKGPARNPVRVNLQRAQDNAWRVSHVAFSGGGAC